MTNRHLWWLVIGLAVACETGPRSSPESTAEVPTPAGVPDPDAAVFAAPIASAHGYESWYEQDAFRAELRVELGGETLLDGEMLMTPDMARTRIEREDGAVAIWDGTEAWVSPDNGAFPRARFHVRTWPYFVSAPMKLRDPGTYLEPLAQKSLRGESYETARLSFAPGVGETPDDWYILYRDLETDRLEAMAYIVTYGTTVDKAEAEPQAVTFASFELIEGVQIPTEWTFWHWSEEEGIRGDPTGSVRLRDPEFTVSSENAFAVPENAVRAGLPE